MSEPLSEQIFRMARQLDQLYHRLILVVAPSGAGKTTAILKVQERTGAPLVNVNLELSRLMLELTQRQRTLQTPRLFQMLVDESSNNLVLFDNTELLFDVNLKQDPLRLLQGLSRNKSVVASWNGAVRDGFLTYAEPDHAEYRRYLVRDFLVASPYAAT